MSTLHRNGNPNLKKKHLFPIIIVLFLFYSLFTVWQISSYGKRDERQEADTAIVLGAGVIGEEPSPVFKERINHGITLYQQGYVKTLIMTGGVGDGASISESRVAKDYAVDMGIPEQAIFIEEYSRITQENMYYARQIMDEQGFHDAIIVSDPLHMKRAMLMAADYGIKAYTSPTPTTRYQTPRTKLPFLAREWFFYTGYLVYRIFPFRQIFVK